MIFTGWFWGPDGRLYFSVGDRGAHVVTKEGVTISNPRNGAVFRCQPDGTELELVHRGLRNPQELAFDQFGNLFADDNNCDKGDHSRLVYVVPGGDSGWNMAYQSLPEPYLTGPWHAESIWRLSHPLQPAYVIPPVGKLGAGPSGFVFSSGTSLPPALRNHFFYCNFTGDGGVESFSVRAKGAGFTMNDHQDFCKPVMASDVDFGYDGKMYISVYPVSPWDRSTRGGRVYTLFDPARVNQTKVTETNSLFLAGFGALPPEQLVELLRHDDLRVRQRAQFALADLGRASVDVLEGLASHDENRLTRLHAIWGLGQIGRIHADVFQRVSVLLNDKDSEVRAQAARVLGDASDKRFGELLRSRLTDDEPRVRFFAALALGRLQYADAIPSLFEMLRSNDGGDRYLRHAGVAALEKIGDRVQVQQYAKDTSAAVRMSVLLVQRRWSDPRIAQFLDDPELSLVTEAARAINDLPLPSARDQLANLAERYQQGRDEAAVPLMRRIINANFQIGARMNAEAVVGIATSQHQLSIIRAEAIGALRDWRGPSTRDRVTGFWQPVGRRDDGTVREVVQLAASKLLASASGSLQTEVADLLAALEVETDDRAFARWVLDENRPESARVAALRLLARREFVELPQIVEHLLASNNGALRSEARDLIAESDVPRAVTLFAELLEDSEATVRERQRAIRTLSQQDTPAASATLDRWAERLREGNVPLELQLDLVEALRASPTELRREAIRTFESSADPADSLSRFEWALAGGDAAAGRALFVGHPAAQCIRCHTVGERGGTAGPKLSHVSAPDRKTDRRFLLESLVSPNENIAPGFGTATLVLTSGKIVAGTIKSEDDQALTLVTPQNEVLQVPHSEIDERAATTSAMPSVANVLTLRELRDLVEYLATLR